MNTIEKIELSAEAVEMIHKVLRQNDELISINRTIVEALLNPVWKCSHEMPK